MTQAYPQFTPVQILEAGQRALADGRHDYAAQFFQHLIDHYGDAPEAASAREAMARIGGQAPVQVNGYSGGDHARAAGAIKPAPPPGGRFASGPSVAQGQPHNVGQPRPVQHAPAPRQPEPPHLRHEPSFGAQEPATDLPRHLTRHSAPPEPVADPRGSGYAAPQRNLVPAPEKHYIIGRVIAGLLLLIGILGVFGGIGLLFAAISDPKIFTVVGAIGPSTAIMFSVSVFVISLVLLILAQVASAIFNGADAMADVARLERFRAGDYGDDD